MKKFLAVCLTLSMALALASCGGNEDTNTTTAPENTAEVVTTVPAEETTVPAEETTLPEETTAAETTAVETTVADTKGLNSTDVKEVIDFYNKAVKATKEGKVSGKQTMKLVDGSLSGDGAIGAILKVLEPAAEKALAKNSVDVENIPSDSVDLLETDAVSATATSSNGKTKIKITLKDQIDGPNADGTNGGPVARGIGTLGSIETALEELGASISEGKDTVKLTYNNAYIECTVDEETGKITGGTWHHLVNINIGNAKAKISILSATLKNFKGKIDFTVAI